MDVYRQVDSGSFCTPQKIYHGVHANEICRSCGVNFKISGKTSSFNLVSKKTDKKWVDYLDRLSCDAKDLKEYSGKSGFSTVICRPCSRKLDRFIKTLDEIEDFQISYERVLKLQDEHIRIKRMAKSPLVLEEPRQKRRQCTPKAESPSVRSGIPVQSPAGKENQTATRILYPIVPRPVLQLLVLTSLLRPVFVQQMPFTGVSIQAFTDHHGNINEDKVNKVEVCKGLLV